MKKQTISITLSEYLNSEKMLFGSDYSDCMEGALRDEYYNEKIVNTVRHGAIITRHVYDNLTQGQKYHFDKHFNHRGDKIVSN